MITQNRFTTAQIDKNVWSAEMLDLLVDFIKNDPKGKDYRHLDWSAEYELADKAGSDMQSSL